MLEFLQQYMGKEAANAAVFAIIFFALLISVGILSAIIRRTFARTPSGSEIRASEDGRLVILDKTRVDENRSLLLVRRDDKEHLLMIGGPSDVVVEANINDASADGYSQAQAKPGHEIARRIIAQRPMRTVSLASSSASVAASLGIEGPMANAAALADHKTASAPAQANADTDLTINSAALSEETEVLTPNTSANVDNLKTQEANANGADELASQLEEALQKMSSTAQPMTAARPEAPTLEIRPNDRVEPPVIDHAGAVVKSAAMPSVETSLEMSQKVEADITAGFAAAMASNIPDGNSSGAAETSSAAENQSSHVNISLDLSAADYPAPIPEINEVDFENAIADLLLDDVVSGPNDQASSERVQETDRGGIIEPQERSPRRRSSRSRGRPDDELESMIGELASPSR